jgi:RNA polymerase sigma factor (sigma-70 family)
VAVDVSLDLPGANPARVLQNEPDEALVRLVGTGNDAAFEAIYDRHHRGLIAFCRHLLSSREEAEDALQHTFASAYRALAGDGTPPLVLKPWLYTIARNRCYTVLRARRTREAADDPTDAVMAGLADEVQQRSDLQDLVSDLHRLPDDQRAALVLFELGDHSHAEIAAVLSVSRDKVKALVFQAREGLLRARTARDTPCAEIRRHLSSRTRALPRRGVVRGHLDRCPACAAFDLEVRRQRAALAIILPVVPSLELKGSVLGPMLGGGATIAGGGAVIAGGGAGAGGVSLGTAGGAGAGAGGVAALATSAGGLASAGAASVGAFAAKSVVAKALTVVALAGAATGGHKVAGTVADTGHHSVKDPQTAAVTAPAQSPSAGAPLQPAPITTIAPPPAHTTPAPGLIATAPAPASTGGAATTPSTTTPASTSQGTGGGTATSSTPPSGGSAPAGNGAAPAATTDPAVDQTTGGTTAPPAVASADPPASGSTATNDPAVTSVDPQPQQSDPPATDPSTGTTADPPPTGSDPATDPGSDPGVGIFSDPDDPAHPGCPTTPATDPAGPADPNAVTVPPDVAVGPLADTTAVGGGATAPAATTPADGSAATTADPCAPLAAPAGTDPATASATTGTTPADATATP